VSGRRIRLQIGGRVYLNVTLIRKILFASFVARFFMAVPALVKFTAF
jgi:hypothetical protein